MIDISYYKNHIYDVVGAIYEVHKELGPGLQEACYQEGLELQLTELGINYERERLIRPLYHGARMKSFFKLDFLCKDDIIVECKALADLGSIQRAQLFNYLRITKLPCSILANFSPPFAVIERYFYDKDLNEVLTVDGQIVRKP